MASRKISLAEAFLVAGRRGLTAAEAERVAGPCWRLRLAELRAEGWRFREDRRRFGRRGVFRWVLLYAPPAEPSESEKLSDPVLFEPEPPRPVSAVKGVV